MEGWRRLNFYIQLKEEKTHVCALQVYGSVKSIVWFNGLTCDLNWYLTISNFSSAIWIMYVTERNLIAMVCAVNSLSRFIEISCSVLILSFLHLNLNLRLIRPSYFSYNIPKHCSFNQTIILLFITLIWFLLGIYRYLFFPIFQW